MCCFSLLALPTDPKELAVRTAHWSWYSSPLLSGHFFQMVDAPVAPLALLIVNQSREEVSLAEVRPQRLSYVYLGVRDLPEQEVADAHLAACPDQ
jgi:hypothetical protein